MPRPRAGEDHAISVLIAEDEESFVDAMTVGLSREGFNVHVARDGNMAMRMFESVDPDVVLLDQMLPGGVSGLDVCRSIRATSSIPIIMVTAKGTEIDTVVALEVGADDYVTKPFRMRELVARIRAVSRRSPATPATVGPAPRATTASSSRARSRWTPSSAGSSSGATRSGCAARSSTCCTSWSRTPAGCSRETCSSTGSGDTTTSATRRRWTSTSSACAPRSRKTPAEPTLITTVRGVGYRFADPGR